MKIPTLALTNFNIVVGLLGGWISLFGLVSYLLKESLYLSEARKSRHRYAFFCCFFEWLFTYKSYALYEVTDISLVYPVISLLAGLVFSPHATNFIRPLDYAGSEENLDAIVSRLQAIKSVEPFDRPFLPRGGTQQKPYINFNA